MKLLTMAAVAGAVLIAAAGYPTVAPAAPAATGARAIDAAVQGTPVIEVQQRRGNRGAGNNNRGNRGNQNANRGGGGNNQGDRNRRRNRDAAIAAGVVGVIGGLILSQQAQSEPEEFYEEPRLRCRYGSYINRYGERRCHRR